MERIERSITPNASRIQALQVALRISLIFYGLKFVFELFRYSIWTKVSKGIPISSRQLGVVELIEENTLKFQIILFVICGILFMSWMHRSYNNLAQFQRLKASPIVSIIGWMVPMFSFIGPFLIYSEIVGGLEEHLAKQNYIRRDSRRFSIKNWWWITWIIAQVVILFSFGYTRTELFYAAVATLLFLISNFLILSSLNDTKMLEQGIGRLKNVTETPSSKTDDLDNIV